MRFGSMRRLFSSQVPETFIKQAEIVADGVSPCVKQIKPAYQLRIRVLHFDAISWVNNTPADIGQFVIALRCRMVAGDGTKTKKDFKNIR